MKHDSKPGPENSVSAKSTKGPLTDAAGEQRGTAAEQSRAWRTLSAEEVSRALHTDPASGLTGAEAARRRKQFGPNALAQVNGRSVLAIFVDQFKSFIVALLVAATIEAVAVLVVIVLNATVGFLTKWKAEQALTALQRQAVPVAHVLREGEEHQIPAAELVPGYVVLVTAGSRVPADGRIAQGVPLQVDEAALTGESHAVTKNADSLPDESAPLGDRWNMVYLCLLPTF